MSAYANSARTYKIFINNTYRGEIANGEVREFEAENGKHTVYAKIDWSKSNKLCINVDDSTVDLEVGTSLVGWRLLFSLVYATLLAHKYLWLREKESTGASPEDVK